MTKQTRTEDGRPTCGFGDCVKPMVAGVWVQIVKDLVNNDEGLDHPHRGALLLCAEHWQNSPKAWCHVDETGEQQTQ